MDYRPIKNGEYNLAATQQKKKGGGDMLIGVVRNQIVWQLAAKAKSNGGYTMAAI